MIHRTEFPMKKKESGSPDSRAERGRIAVYYIFARVRILPGGLLIS